MALAQSSLGPAREGAKANGVHCGQPPALTKHQQREAIAGRENGETLANIAQSYNVSHTTIMRLLDAR